MNESTSQESYFAADRRQAHGGKALLMRANRLTYSNSKIIATSCQHFSA